jgi:hypothetical protein
MAVPSPFFPARGPFSAPTLLALAVLVLNDHVLKASCPSWMTGKASDVAGLFLFPILAGAFGGAHSKAVARGAALAGGAFFALCKLSPELCAFVTEHVARTTADPTDLVALPMLALGVRFAAPIAPRGVTRWRDRIGTVLAAVASMATSAVPPPMRPEAPQAQVLAAPRVCAGLEMLGVEPKGQELIVHVRLTHTSPASTTTPACNVRLLAKVTAKTSDALASTSQARSAPVVVDPGTRVEVAVSVALPYPLACDASFGGDVQAWENEVGYAEGERPAAAVLMGGCVKAVAVP